MSRPDFGQVIRGKRRELNLSQQEVADRIQTSNAYIAYLEADKRHPSDKIVGRLAEVLGMDRHELFLLANPHTEALLSHEAESESGAVWERFRKNQQLQRIHNISNDEIDLLSRVALLGEIRSEREFIYILNSVRHAVGR